MKSPKTISPALIPEAHLYIAYCDYQLGQYENAVQDCQEVIDNQCGAPYTHYFQLLKASSYKQLVKSGAVSASEANPQIEQALMAVLEKRWVDNKSIIRAMKGLNKLNSERGQ
jgi:hypothetical protein